MSELREAIDAVLANEPLDRVSMERGAVMALESLPCWCGDNPNTLRIVCDRCQRLRSLAPLPSLTSERKGGAGE